jgi:hypothetical protein
MRANERKKERRKREIGRREKNKRKKNRVAWVYIIELHA